jgi:tyrosine decarboxylase/aspartate 1-decarboxylase
LNKRFQVDVGAVKKAINPNTIAIVGIAGTTALGAVDPIDELSELALEKSLYLHVDAAFGGFVLPFLKDLEYDVPDFDFSVPGVCSLTVDPHKMGLAPIPAGGILFRNAKLRKKMSWGIPYLSGGETEHATLVGTRSGASVIAVWTVMRHLGREGYRKIVKNCMRLTSKLVEQIGEIEGLGTAMEPVMNIVGVKSDVLNIRRIAAELRLREWAISLFPRHLRVVIMPHVREEHLNGLLQDLKSIVNELRG